jgi:hypothetical protein
MQVVEAVAAADQLAYYERRPPLGEDFGRLGDRAELSVAAHLRLSEHDVATRGASTDFALSRSTDCGETGGSIGALPRDNRAAASDAVLQ